MNRRDTGRGTAARDGHEDQYHPLVVEVAAHLNAGLLEMDERGQQGRLAGRG